MQGSCHHLADGLPIAGLEPPAGPIGTTDGRRRGFYRWPSCRASGCASPGSGSARCHRSLSSPRRRTPGPRRRAAQLTPLARTMHRAGVPTCSAGLKMRTRTTMRILSIFDRICSPSGAQTSVSERSVLALPRRSPVHHQPNVCLREAGNPLAMDQSLSQVGPGELDGARRGQTRAPGEEHGRAQQPPTSGRLELGVHPDRGSQLAIPSRAPVAPHSASWPATARTSRDQACSGNRSEKMSLEASRATSSVSGRMPATGVR